MARRWALAGAVGFAVVAAACAGAQAFLLAGLFGAAAPAWYALLTERWRRRARLAAEPFPEAWRRVLQEQVGYYAALDPERRAAFERQVRWFAEEHRFAGVGGQEATEELKVLAAASAVMLVFARPGEEYPRIGEILFYPRPFDEEFRIRGADRPISGMNTSYGSVVLSAPDLVRSFRNDRQAFHVGLHEFAHALDRHGDRWDGLPPGLSGEAASEWGRRLEPEMASILAGKSSLCAYGASDPVEFFAVATETYFKTPDVMRRRNPEIFAILERFYGTLPEIRPQPDPSPGKRRPDAASPPGPREPKPS